MKKLIWLVLVIVAATSLVGCGGGNSSSGLPNFDIAGRWEENYGSTGDFFPIYREGEGTPAWNVGKIWTFIHLNADGTLRPTSGFAFADIINDGNGTSGENYIEVSLSGKIPKPNLETGISSFDNLEINCSGYKTYLARGQIVFHRGIYSTAANFSISVRLKDGTDLNWYTFRDSMTPITLNYRGE